MVGAIFGADDFAIPIVVLRRHPGPSGALHAIACVPRKYSRDAPRRRTQWGAGDGRRLEIVHKRLGALSVRDATNAKPREAQPKSNSETFTRSEPASRKTYNSSSNGLAGIHIPFSAVPAAGANRWLTDTASLHSKFGTGR